MRCGITASLFVGMSDRVNDTRIVPHASPVSEETSDRSERKEDKMQVFLCGQRFPRPTISTSNASMVMCSQRTLRSSPETRISAMTRAARLSDDLPERPAMTMIHAWRRPGAWMKTLSLNQRAEYPGLL